MSLCAFSAEWSINIEHFGRCHFTDPRPHGKKFDLSAHQLRRVGVIQHALDDKVVQFNQGKSLCKSVPNCSNRLLWSTRQTRLSPPLNRRFVRIKPGEKALAGHGLWIGCSTLVLKSSWRKPTPASAAPSPMAIKRHDNG